MASFYRALAHGLSRAMIRVVQGGKALGGFLSGFAGSLLGGLAKGVQNVDIMTKTIMVAIAGGTASVLGGGKFANGAMSAAFVFMFNEMGKSLKWSLKRLWERKGTILRDHWRGIKGGAKGLHALLTSNPSSVKGGLVGQGLFEMLTLKVGASSGSHMGYEIVPIENIWLTRGYAYTNFLTYDTVYTVGSGQMYTAPDTCQAVPWWR